MENVPEVTNLSSAELECEANFKTTHTRLLDGKYQVRLPLTQNPVTLGDSKKICFD